MPCCSPFSFPSPALATFLPPLTGGSRREGETSSHSQPGSRMFISGYGMSKLWGQPLEVCPENMANVQRTGLKTCPYVCSVSFNVGVTCPQVTRCIHNRAAVTRRRVTGTETCHSAPFASCHSGFFTPLIFGTDFARDATKVRAGSVNSVQMSFGCLLP